ncbi:rRNA maturation RNase YbeY [Candidatus Nomurabacteria bacterium RIFCSPHIGHO2_01_FULL_40_12]|uniref:Endoribonuclease YbeY n=1 Tax=Candidatus Nomurabacteria bacterium RIFCSPHIGHO2_01_FULL_40_12 TaxID=1801737 RepID=A0A1F6UYI2_9BACT|nr:MAG: rRNA maturation RNase YbeY [Candidatus Nomurabacteria bacterium RIFCSPHIGHO2_01_FULL_40_12]
MRFEKKIEIIKNDILSKDYILSVGFVDKKKSRAINRTYRKKDKATNVLSFSLRKQSGELVLCKAIIKKEAKNSNRTFEEWLGFLVIHGMLHLKGLKHSSIMEKLEEAYDKKYFGGNRRRVLFDESRSGRIHQRGKKS